MEKLVNISEVERFLAFLKTSRQGSFRVEKAVGYSEFLEKRTDEPAEVFKSLRSLTKTLQDLARVAEKELEVTKERLLPETYRKGLYTLPFEVFARILELAYVTGNGWSGREQALWVNHYFREVMVKVPKLWTTVDCGKFSPVQLTRSRSRPLSITMDLPRISDDRYRRSFETLLPLSRRWKSLSVVRSCSRETIDDRNGIVYGRLKQLRDTFRGVTFPALESLSVDYFRDYLVDVEYVVLSGQDDPNTSIRSFFSSWDMPALRNFEAVGFIPVLPPSCRNTLTSLRLTLHGGEVFFDLRAVIDVLRPFSVLQKLSFDFWIDEWLDDGVEIATLPGLKTLSIESAILRGEHVRMLLDSIHAPNLRELNITAEVFSFEEGAEYLDAFFPKDVPRWMELESISCFLEVTDEENSHLTDSPFEVLCTRLPRLRHLTLKSRTTAQPSDLLLHEHFGLPSWNRQVTLSTLSIVDCVFFETSFIVKLGNVINATEFETLEIHRCPKINMGAMRAILPSNKRFICSPYKWNQERNKFKGARRSPPEERGGFTRLLRRQAELAASREQNSLQSDQAAS